jgi:hypothetical protein
MKNKLLFLLAIILIASCSAPKYSYHFDTYDYNSGKKAKAVATQPAEAQPEILIDPAALLASSDKTVMGEPSLAHRPEEVRKTYLQMTRAEKREVRKLIKGEIKKYIKAKKENVESVKATKAMDSDLKLAAIFGAVGLVLTLFGGVSSAFWVIGVIAIVIGVVFLVKWLVRQ